MRLTIRLLGPAQLSYGDRTLSFRAPPKTLPLLALLLDRAGAAWTREALAFALWPDSDEPAARANLRRHLHQLNLVLPPCSGEPWIVTEAAEVRWNGRADADVDVLRFRDAFRCGDLTRAVEAYGGDLLTGINDECILPAREELRMHYVDAAFRSIALAREAGDERGAIDFAERVLREDPWREDALRAAMSARYALGDRSGVLAGYQAFRDRLRAELDVTPSPETAALYDLIRRNAATAVLRNDGRAAPAELRFAGRERVLRSLLRRWQQAADGAGTTAFVTGDAGIGKTRTIAELCEAIRAQGGRVLRGGTAYAEPQPYQPFVEALRDGLPALLTARVPDVWLSAIAALVPDIRSYRPDLRPAPEIGPERERQRLFEAVAETFVTLARGRPLCIVVEDLHWAGSATRALLDYCARRIGGVPVFLVASLRGDEPETSPDALVNPLARDGIATTAALGPLDDGAVQQIVEDAFADGGDDAGARDRCARLITASGGNPLFLGEAIRAARDGEAAEIPPSFQTAIGARLGRIDEAARAVAQAAAIAGTGFDIRTVCGILGWDEAEVLDAMDTLLDHHIVRRGTERSGTEFAFAHHLIQQTVVAGVDAGSARQMHRRCARVLARSAGSRDALAADVALQFACGGLAPEAAAWYERAAAHALAVYANEAAAHAAERGSALAVDPEMRFALAAACEEAYRRMGDVARQRDALQQLDAAADAAGGTDHRCEALRRRVAMLHATGDRSGERRAIDELARTAEASGDALRIAQAALAQAEHDCVAGTAVVALASIDAALRSARIAQSAGAEIALLSLEAEVHAGRNDRAAALASIGRARALADEAGDAFVMGRVYRSAANAFFNLNDDDATRVHASALLELACRTGDRAAEADAHARLGTMHGRRFALDAADAHYRTAHDLYVRLGDRHGAASTTLNAGHSRGIVGDWASAAEHFARAAVLFAELGDLRRGAIAHYNAGMAANETGRLDDARREFARAAELSEAYEAPAVYAPALAALGVVHRRSGAPELAYDALSRAVAIERNLPNAFEFPTDLAEFAYAAAEAGRERDARAAVDELERLPPEAFEEITFPQQVWLAAGAACCAFGDLQRAAGFAARAMACYESRLASITDERRRASYRRMRINREAAALAGRPLEHEVTESQ